MKCIECGWKYPYSILSPVHSLGGRTEPMCGICALNYINKIHGLKRTKFQGEMAEENRQAAIRWRKQHPEQAPKVS